MLEFAEHDRNAWLVKPQDTGALAEGLQRLLGDAALRQRLATGGLATAAERQWDGIYDQLIEEYRLAAMGRRRRAA